MCTFGLLSYTGKNRMLKEKSKLYDAPERERALDITQSFIVQAPAGSGKTELLIQRILHLLCYVKRPEEILAITFTKKAANEMRLRLIQAFKLAKKECPNILHLQKTWQLAKKVLERDEERSWGLLKNPNQLNLQTIDSLCSYLTRQLPLLSQFGALPAINTQPKVLYEKAIDGLLAHLDQEYPWKKKLEHLILHLDNDLPQLKSLLTTLLAKRDQWKPYLHYANNPKLAKLQLENYIQTFVEEKINNVAQLFPQYLLRRVSEIAFDCSHNLNAAGLDNFLNSFNDGLPPKANIGDLAKWVGISRLLLTKGEHTIRKQVTKNEGFRSPSSCQNKDEKSKITLLKNEFIQILNQLEGDELLRESLGFFQRLPKLHYSDHDWKTLHSLLEILKVLLAELRLTFVENGQIDFIENAEAALLALGDEEHPTNLTLALDYQFKHILIDEFQDTSITQYQLLKKLIGGWENNDGRTLFIVGDPMQSIYRFREAEVGLFIKIWQEGIGHFKLNRLNLSVNFRSTNTIVEWNNQHFAKIFPTHDLISDGAVAFSKSTTPDNSQDHNTYVQIYSCDKSDSSQAMLLAEKIKDLQQASSSQTIAILVRARSHIQTIIAALKQEGITFAASEIDNLYTKQSIKDLLSLTNALTDLSNKPAWCALLRCPWCGFTLNDLLTLTSREEDQFIWYQLLNPDAVKQLSAHAQKQVARIVPILQDKIIERDRSSLAEIIETTWMLLGGPACLSIDTTKEDTDFFFSLLANFDLINYSDSYFLDLIKNSYTAGTKFSSHIVIMTIHAAKGLEFDTVIIPHLEKTMPHQDKELLAWLEYPLHNQNTGLLLAPLQAPFEEMNFLHQLIYQQQKTKLLYEADRLLYVAATRARKRLILTFSIDENEKIPSNSLLQKIWPQIKDECTPISQFNSEKLITQKSTKILKRLANDWENPLGYQPKTTALHHAKLGFSLKDDSKRIIGNIIHLLLQAIGNKGIAWWQALQSAAKERIILANLKMTHISTDEEITCKTILDHVAKVIDDPVGQWILAPYAICANEYAISVNNEGKNNYIIDRTFVDENDIRWIIDYKTMLVDIQNKESYATYLMQLEQYYDAFRLVEDREIKLGLYFTSVPVFYEHCHQRFRSDDMNAQNDSSSGVFIAETL